MKKSFYSLLVASAMVLVGFSSCEKPTGSLTGYVIDSQTGYGLVNAKVSLTTDLSVTNGDDAEKSSVTGVDGSYMIDGIKLGTYRLIIEANGFFARIENDIVIQEGENFAPQEIIVEAPEGTAFRVVLIWGENPYDLDSHLTGPDGYDGRFHVYYSNDYNDDNSVDLDVDDTYSYGPETITIYSFLNGTYRYSVHNYSDQSISGGNGIYNSPARVEIYNAAGLVQSFNAPVCSVSANTWRVFEIVSVGGTATINPINEYVTADGSYDMDTFKGSGVKKPMSIDSF
jgi:hypothetical protein